MPATPPNARQVPADRTRHGDTVTDEFAWLADKDDPATIAYLEAENAWTERATAHLADLRATLFSEIRNRTQETDLSVPSRKGGYWYYTRTVRGKQYGIQCRRAVREGEVDPPPTGDGGPLVGEDVLLDGNKLAEGHEFFALGTFDVSPDGHRLAFSTDFTGDERFTLKIKDLETGEILADEIPDAFYGSAWSADGSTLFYITVDEAWRPYRVWRHVIGQPSAQDTVVYEETDERFWVGVELTRSEKFIVIDANSKVTSEVRVIDAAGALQTLGRDADEVESQVTRGRRQSRRPHDHLGDDGRHGRRRRLGDGHRRSLASAAEGANLYGARRGRRYPPVDQTAMRG